MKREEGARRKRKESLDKKEGGRRVAEGKIKKREEGREGGGRRKQ